MPGRAEDDDDDDEGQKVTFKSGLVDVDPTDCAENWQEGGNEEDLSTRRAVVEISSPKAPGPPPDFSRQRKSAVSDGNFVANEVRPSSSNSKRRPSVGTRRTSKKDGDNGKRRKKEGHNEDHHGGRQEEANPDFARLLHRQPGGGEERRSKTSDTTEKERSKERSTTVASEKMNQHDLRKRDLASSAPSGAPSASSPTTRKGVSEQTPSPVSTGDNNDVAEDEERVGRARSESFPFKLFRILEESEREGNDSIISFIGDDGVLFLVHQPKKFVSDIMPRYFSTSRIPSFQRQLNLYGFQRISQGPNRGAYFHPSKFFVKGRKDLCKLIVRKTPTNENADIGEECMKAGTNAAITYSSSSSFLVPQPHSYSVGTSLSSSFLRGEGSALDNFCARRATTDRDGEAAGNNAGRALVDRELNNVISLQGMPSGIFGASHSPSISFPEIITRTGAPFRQQTGREFNKANFVSQQEEAQESDTSSMVRPISSQRQERFVMDQTTPKNPLPGANIESNIAVLPQPPQRNLLYSALLQGRRNLGPHDASTAGFLLRRTGVLPPVTPTLSTQVNPTASSILHNAMMERRSTPSFSAMHDTGDSAAATLAEAIQGRRLSHLGADSSMLGRDWRSASAGGGPHGHGEGLGDICGSVTGAVGWSEEIERSIRSSGMINRPPLQYSENMGNQESEHAVRLFLTGDPSSALSSLQHRSRNATGLDGISSLTYLPPEPPDLTEQLLIQELIAHSEQQEQAVAREQVERLLVLQREGRLQDSFLLGNRYDQGARVPGNNVATLALRLRQEREEAERRWVLSSLLLASSSGRAMEIGPSANGLGDMTNSAGLQEEES